MSAAAALAEKVGGYVRGDDDGPLIFVPLVDAVDVIECRITGRVYVNGVIQLGKFSDGPEALAVQYRAYRSAVTA